jgi:uncharacterized lipoprotein YddW (UPF0748 family)
MIEHSNDKHALDICAMMRRRSPAHSSCGVPSSSGLSNRRPASPYRSSVFGFRIFPQNWRALLLLAVVPVTISAAPGQTVAPPPPPREPTALDAIAPYRRCLWVTRWDWETAQDIERICYNAASARFSDIMFQVRGAGTVYYPSRIEPWAGELTDRRHPAPRTGRDPGWNPLATALAEAHRRGLRLHAYMNVLPGWSHDELPDPASGQAWAIHRSWFMMDRGLRRMTAANGYAFLDPGKPEVREHLAALFGELASKHAVDGIHLDYIRYPHEAGDYSYNPPVVEAFQELAGGTPTTRPEAWFDFRRAQVNATVEAIAGAARRARPGVELSAAVLSDPSKGRNEAGQSPFEWLDKGWLDAIAPMVYTEDMARFAELSRPFQASDIRKRVWLGIWANPQRNPNLSAQVRRAAAQGFGAVAVFGYSDLFPSHQPSARAVQVYRTFAGEADPQ